MVYCPCLHILRKPLKKILSPPHGMYFILSLMMIGAMLCSSLKTSLVLEVKAAEAWAPGMLWTDVNVSVSGMVWCFGAKIYCSSILGKDIKLLNSFQLVENIA